VELDSSSGQNIDMPPQENPGTKVAMIDLARQQKEPDSI